MISSKKALIFVKKYLNIQWLEQCVVITITPDPLITSECKGVED